MVETKLLQLCEATSILKQLEARGYIERKEEEVIFTKKAEDLLVNVTDKLVAKTNNVDDWIDEYRSLFPKGIKTGGYPVRGDRNACIKKMQIFMKNNPEYDKDIILEATQKYINRKELDGYNYIQISHYFIYKNNVSNLASECSALLEDEEIDSNSNFSTEM